MIDTIILHPFLYRWKSQGFCTIFNKNKNNVIIPKPLKQQKTPKLKSYDQFFVNL